MENTFENEIRELIQRQFSDYNTDTIIANSLLLQYIIRKTKAADKDESKARKSFANLYAIYVIIEDYIKQGYDKKRVGLYSKSSGSQFSTLLELARKKPFGKKTQNHAFNNRMNDEFFRFFPLQKEKGVYPIIRNLTTKHYWINEKYIILKIGSEELNISHLILTIIDRYTEVIKEKFEKFINDCKVLQELGQLEVGKAIVFIEQLLAPDVDARLFEIVSYSILKHYYHDRTIFWGFSKEELQEASLKLYKTGRTNANDGGIDFVMKPLGTFFQVTETLDFKKYFLDIDKVERYPITFVIKSTETNDNIREILKNDAKEAGWSDEVIDKYLNCIEKIININDLKSYLYELKDKEKISGILDEMINQSMVEFNYENED